MPSLKIRWSAVAAACLSAGLGTTGCGVEQGPPPTPMPVPESIQNPAVLSGGTLAITRDATRAVVADPSIDQLHVYSLADGQQELEVSYTFDAGDEPGRIVEGEDHVMYVSLRRGGELARVDLDVGTVDRVAVCPAPRGVAYDGSARTLHVACAGGELVTLDADLNVTRRLQLDKDLRDVAIAKGKLVVTRFRAAELLVLDDEGTISQRLAPFPFTSAFDGRTFAPAVAYQIQVLDSGNVMMLHQRAFVGEVPIPEEPPVDEFSGSAYGGGGRGDFDCGSGIVHAAITVFDPATGSVAQPPNTGGLGSLVLPLDLAISGSGRLAAVAAGNDRLLETEVYEAINFDVVDNCFPGTTTRNAQILGEPVAARYLPDGNLLVQTRQPATLQRIDLSEEQVDGFGFEVAIAASSTAALPGPSRRHAGHALFHKAASPSSPIACASCHPEGQDDGLTWDFEKIGLRRTQNLAGGLLDTLPLHWNGEFEGMHNLVADVFVNRMGGTEMKADRVEVLQNWIHNIPDIPPSAGADAEAVARGKTLYFDDKVACASCHGGDALTNNSTVDVGTGLALQVPTLRSIAYRAPYMHTGCAATLMDRFTNACGGGDAHGKTSQLSEAELQDLVAYLETL